MNSDTAHDLNLSLDFVLRNMPVGVGVLDTENQLLLQNEPLQTLFGTTSPLKGPELLGEQVVRPDGKPFASSRHPITMTFKRGTPIRDTAMGIRNPARQSTVWVVMHTEPLFDESGQVTRVLLSCVDITRQKEQERVIADQQNQLANAARVGALGELTAAMAHEIANPLAIVDGKAQMLLARVKRGQVDAQGVETVASNILGHVRRIEKVINAIRVFTVQENASDFLVTNIKTVIEAAVNVTQGFMLQTSVQFTVEDIPDDLYINCRPGQLANALILLIQHARRAVLSNDIRIVRLTTHRPNDATIELRVAHNGTKIPSEMLPHLFQTVPDSDAPIPAEFAGFASVAQIVMDHQAEVGVVEDAELTRFFIRLPLKPNQ